MTAKAQDILLGIVIGDALGTAVDGLGKGHIHSHFRTINDYIDPAPALKGNMAKWKKPGLYSSISQFAFLLSLCPPRRPFINPFQRYVAESPGVGDCESGIFRYADSVEKRLISAVRDPRSAAPTSSLPCSRLVPASLPLSFRKGSLRERISSTVFFTTLFTRDIQTVAAAISLVCLAGSLLEQETGTIQLIRHAVEINEMILGSIHDNPGTIFEMKLNPDILAREISFLNEILERISPVGSPKESEDIICRMINTRLKTPVTRATVNLPAALLPFALSLSSIYQDDPFALYHAVREGGSAAPLTAMTGALLAGRTGADRLPDLLVRNLVNRRRVLTLVEALTDGSIPSGFSDEFLAAEASLTAKELDEHSARVKHSRTKQRGDPVSRGDQERKLTRHVVESWTKLDRAKWKKEQRRTDKKDEI